MEYDVTVDRDVYIGGSDVPVIMGISTFKTRYELLLEKAGLKESDFVGNRYTVYGQKLEPQIRAHINSKSKNKFEPNRITVGDIRCHSDGFNGKAILEIKTTSHIYETVEEYKVYLVQLLLYMQMNKVKNGMLAVYERPDDFNTVFDPKRLQIFKIKIEKYKDLLSEINAEIDRFRADLAKLKENPLLSEQDFQPNELVRLSNTVMVLENRMADFKAIEQEYNDMKQKLYEAMQKYNVKSWTTPNGTKITKVEGTESSVEKVEEFDMKAFQNEQPEQYRLYTKTVEKKKKGRSGYIKITLPKM